MPISEYYGGHGREVLKNMKSRYGSKAGQRVFYATDAKRRKKAKRKRSRSGVR